MQTPSKNQKEMPALEQTQKLRSSVVLMTKSEKRRSSVHPTNRLRRTRFKVLISTKPIQKMDIDTPYSDTQCKLDWIADKQKQLVQLFCDFDTAPLEAHLQLMEQTEKKARQFKEKLSEECKKSTQEVIETHSYLEREKMSQLETQTMTSDTLAENQKLMFSAVDAVNKNIRVNIHVNQRVMDKRKLYEDNKQQLYMLAQMMREEQEKDEEMELLQLNKYKEREDELVSVRDAAFQISVLKLQLSYYLRVGFTHYIDGIEKGTALRKDNRFWDKNKEKKMTLQDVFYFMVLQLYPYNYRMLERLSSKVAAWKLILAGQKSVDQLDEVKQMLDDKKPAKIIKTKRRMVILACPNQQRLNRDKDILLDRLINFDNGLITVKSISITKEEGFDGIEIGYITYISPEIKIKKIELHLLTQFGRENISRLLMKGSKVVCLRIEIPRLNSQVLHQIYEEVYELIRKEK